MCAESTERLRVWHGPGFQVFAVRCSEKSRGKTGTRRRAEGIAQKCKSNRQKTTPAALPRNSRSFDSLGSTPHFAQVTKKQVSGVRRQV